MAADTAAMRQLARDVKKLALERAKEILSDPSHPLYNTTFETVLKNAVPRSQEITGEDGEAIKVELVKYADNTTTIPFSAEGLPTANTESV